jgi:glycosyltransferase involved in cell wall biosynthesis
VLLNGRAVTRPTITGVERFSAEVIPRLVALAPDRYRAVYPSPGLRRSRLTAHAWEQLALPARAAELRAPVLFSPANLAPLAWPRNVLVVHDAAAIRHPGAYTAPYRAWHGPLLRALGRRALAVVTVSEFSRNELIELAGIDPHRLTVIPGAVDARFNPDADAAAAARRYGLSRPYVLTVATADRRKNLAALAPVAKTLARLGVELVWAGDSRPYFTSDVAPEGLRRLGYVDDADLPGLYAGALAFVQPSLYEGFGLTCIEAMACGTPVVAAARAALPETCGDAALLVDPSDTHSLTEAVTSAASDEALRHRLSAAGTARARIYSWARAARTLNALLGELAGR